MSLNSFLVTDEIRPLPGSGWTSKNAANTQDSVAKYKEKLNIPRGQKGYIDPAVFNLNDNFNKNDLMNIEPKRSCVVSKPECVKYNYVIPENYLKEGFENAKIENQILENEQREYTERPENSENVIDSLKNEIESLKTTIDSLLVEKHYLVEFIRGKQVYLSPAERERPNEKKGGKKKSRKKNKTHNRRITKRLRSKKIPRKCFSRCKREK